MHQHQNPLKRKRLQKQKENFPNVERFQKAELFEYKPTRRYTQNLDDVLVLCKYWNFRVAHIGQGFACQWLARVEDQQFNREADTPARALLIAACEQKHILEFAAAARAEAQQENPQQA